MPTDADLFVESKTVYRDLTDAEAARNLAASYDLSADSLRGRLSRADTPKNWARVAKRQAMRAESSSPSIERQKTVIQNSHRILDEKRFHLSGGVGLFMSDVHAPYTRWDAWELTLKLIELVEPDYLTGMNDFVDNSGFGRWDDDRSNGGKSWSADLANLRNLEGSMYRSMQSAAPEAFILGIAGNHDNWYHRHLRKNAPQVAESMIYMEFLFDERVLVFTRGYRENHIEIAPGLVWWHGQFASKLATTNARNTLTQFMKDGIARSVIVAHTHRPARIEGSSVGLPGVTFINAPCLCRIENVPYLRRDPQGWGLGVVISQWSSGIMRTRNSLIEYIEEKGELVCYFEGVRLSVPLDKDSPDDYR